MLQPRRLVPALLAAAGAVAVVAGTFLPWVIATASLPPLPGLPGSVSARVNGIAHVRMDPIAGHDVSGLVERPAGWFGWADVALAAAGLLLAALAVYTRAAGVAVAAVGAAAAVITGYAIAAVPSGDQVSVFGQTLDVGYRVTWAAWLVLGGAVALCCGGAVLAGLGATVRNGSGAGADRPGSGAGADRPGSGAGAAVPALSGIAPTRSTAPRPASTRPPSPRPLGPSIPPADPYGATVFTAVGTGSGHEPTSAFAPTDPDEVPPGATPSGAERTTRIRTSRRPDRRPPAPIPVSLREETQVLPHPADERTRPIRSHPLNWRGE
ncbi:hypothetical protein P0W64_09195 [Tsukamurella sp. 8F]|uniref:hypothetical protein n=1 Tax=unclassified Tsukamurella TaxID=2633480 RepID=UPI0023B8CB85|nr:MULTISPECIES: hypothetical protein [unclassified Tsukamurella]MDF0531913.1 hypothetical protein [Tsukamurella sp. 8J]MDF0586947.1 hypothetical protein [Tsukamurella sp. 8F]